MDQPVVGWLERPKHKVGLDNLGTQQPCVFIYTRLLPGVTNVTDRVAYYGFYPWFILAFERRFPNAADADFKKALRRADCLFTLVAEQHAIACGDHDDAIHGAACAGRQKLRPAADALMTGGSLDIEVYANRSDDNTKRYFKNPLGGLGQYYLGPLRDEYFILRGNSRTGLQYFIEHAGPLAASYGEGVDEDRFFGILAKEAISKTDLENLAVFCPCNIHSGHRERARTALLRLLLEGKSSDGIARQMTFRLLMEFLQTAGAASTKDPVKHFLGSCYAETIGTERWVVPDDLVPTRSRWALYARNEMMSLAWNTFFKLALDELDGNPKPFESVHEAAAWLLQQPSFSLSDLRDFSTMLDDDRRLAPDRALLSSDQHEISFWQSLAGSTTPSAEVAFGLLVRLVMRWGHEIDSYTPVGLPKGALNPYPLTLNSLNRLAKSRWQGLSRQRWLESLLVDTLCAHQRVAIRKLGEMGEDTLMFRITDAGLSVHRRLERVVETAPRLRQAFHMLLDLGLTTSTPGMLPTLTELGTEVLGGLRG